MDVKKELRSETEFALLSQKKETKRLEALLKKSKEDELKIEKQLDCDHEWKTDIAIMGGCDIDTCKKCGVQWVY